VRAHGMRLMRPGKTWQSWRPIITVEIDEHHCHETVMGIDGQNPNLKERFELRQADHTSKIDIRVWHRSQSKKKTKKRTLVASASHSLGELLRQQEKEPREDPEELELRLHCQSASKSIASKGRPQNGATVLLKIHAPPNVRRDLDLTQADQNESHEDWGVGSSSGAGSSTRVSEPSESMPPSPTDDNWPDLDGTLTSLRRRRHRHSGYNINSDDNEDYSASASDDDDAPTKRLLFSDGEEPYDYEPSEHVIRVSSSGPGEWIQSIWPAILPQYTERIEVHLELTFIERVLASFTTYSALKAAHTDRDYEQVFTRLQMEWTYVGGLLVAMAAVSTAVFAIGPGSVFNVQSYACTSIAASSISSGLGIATDAWFLLRYNWADLHTFKVRPPFPSPAKPLTLNHTDPRPGHLRLLLLLCPLRARARPLPLRKRGDAHDIPRARRVRGMAVGCDDYVFCNWGRDGAPVFGVWGALVCFEGAWGGEMGGEMWEMGAWGGEREGGEA
ncbi:hypothetical protein C0991_001597, partial [Blastosporella zonata]